MALHLPEKGRLQHTYSAKHAQTWAEAICTTVVLLTLLNDGCADKDSYRHGGHADKRRYRHDRVMRFYSELHHTLFFILWRVFRF